ncbi:MAG: DUF11 domain-containing protein [Balneolaceae bacterium]|nr:DUF11 domain-containing protein [Balneolaceae bacterium]
MEKQMTTITRTLCGKLFGFFTLLMVVGLTFMLAPNSALAQTVPQAGEEIENQANATYTDNNGNPRTAQSNTVTTVVQQVAAVTITNGVTKNVSPGGYVDFSHTITNNGNGNDTFALVATPTSANFTFTDIKIYPDQGGGVPDLNNEITGSTPTIGAGQTYNIVVRATVPSSAVDGESESIDITATSDFDTAESASTDPDDVAQVEEDAVITVTKDYLDSGGNVTTGGDVGETVTVRFSISNTGNADATNLSVTDPLPTGFVYQPGTAVYQSASRTDTDGDSDGYKYNATNQTITLTSGTLASGATASLTFEVVVNTGTEGTTISNTGTYNHDDLGTAETTNPALFNVNERYGIETVDNVGADDDVIEAGPVNQGAVVDFVNRFENTGTASDSYKITLSGQSNYPNGTTFTLHRTDGSGTVTSQITANGGGDFIIGPIAEGAQFEVVVRADLPNNASGGPYNLTKTLTSVNDLSQSAVFTDRLTSVTASTVDVTNDESLDTNSSAAGNGVQPTGEASAVTTNTTDPNTTTSFTLFINNTSGVSDTYNLAASTDNTFGSVTLPSGWSVEFRNTGGTPITSTGSIPAGGAVEVTAVVTVPSNATPGAQSIYFRARSGATGAADVKHDAVNVNAVRSITLVSDQGDDVVPGGSVTYTHTLTNTGNVIENDSGTPLQVSLAHTQASGFQSVVFLDVNNDGVIDGGDTQITGAGGTVTLPGGTLTSGASVQLLVRVSAGTGVTDGTVNNTTLTVQGTGVNTVSNTDNTEVVTGNLEIVKTQSLSPTGPFSGDNAGDPDLQADPGDIIYYRIVVTNNGSAPVTNITLTDDVPDFTTYEVAATVSGDGSPSIDSQPSVGGTGIITVSVAQLNAGQSFTIEFAVEINSN